MIQTRATHEAREQAGDVPFATAHNGGSLGLLCNRLKHGESLTLTVTRGDAWGVVVTMPDARCYEAKSNTVHNALWRILITDVD